MERYSDILENKRTKIIKNGRKRSHFGGLESYIILRVMYEVGTY